MAHFRAGHSRILIGRWKWRTPQGHAFAGNEESWASEIWTKAKRYIFAIVKNLIWRLVLHHLAEKQKSLYAQLRAGHRNMLTLKTRFFKYLYYSVMYFSKQNIEQFQ